MSQFYFLTRYLMIRSSDMNFNSFGHYKPWKIRFKKKIRFKNISLERRYSRLQVTFLSRYFFKKKHRTYANARRHTKSLWIYNDTKARLPSSISLTILLERTRTSHLPIHHLAEQKKTAGLIAVSISETKTWCSCRRPPVVACKRHQALRATLKVHRRQCPKTSRGELCFFSGIPQKYCIP